MRFQALWATVTLLLGVGCGGGLPDRYVVENDLGDLRYRRFQKVLDVEFPIEGNAAVGYTATYVHRDEGHTVRFATAFVTVYRKARALTAEIRDQLDTLGTYDVSVGDLDGEHVYWLDDGEDRWALWISGRIVVKLGAQPEREIPEDLAAKYTSLYPSDLDERGRAESGAVSAGRSRKDKAESAEDDLDIPRHLREGAPR